ncbi:MAG: cytochrome c [Acidobacteria bacterium]|nr:cytochrome c [Acidobacteriota bacterium]
MPMLTRCACLVPAAALLVTLASTPIGASQPSAAELKARAEGRALYTEHCASCHGPAARGNGPAADSLRRLPTDLTGFSQANGGVFPSERLRQVIDGRGVGSHGSVEMPVWGSVFKATAGNEQSARARIEAILTFLQSIQERVGEDR